MSAAVLVAAVFLVFWPSGSAAGAALYERGAPYNPYISAVLAALPEYERQTADADCFSSLANGDIVECFDAQAAPAIAQGAAKCCLLQCLATVVIALDREQTDVAIKSWRDLAAADLATSWDERDPFIFAALAYGLEGKNFTKQSALAFWRAQYAAGNFRANDWSAPVIVCFDFQAVSLIRQGRKLEIVIPQEGTLAYRHGLLSDKPLAIPSDDELLAAGLRRLDGRCTDAAYPNAGEYNRAVCLTDFARFFAATDDLDRDVRRTVFRTRLYSGADGREHVAFALISIILAILWREIALHRAARPDVRRAINALALLIVGWLFLRLFKFQLPALAAASRYCWYAYYLFELGIPLALLYLAATFNRPATLAAPPRWWRRFALFALPLFALVLTNDWHQFVFAFDWYGNWSHYYRYNFGFYLIFAYLVTAFAIALGLLLKAGWQSPRRAGWAWPLLWGAVIVAYVLGYALRVSAAWPGDFTTIFCLFAIGFFEIAQRTNLIPANTGYSRLFSASPLDMQLLDKNGETVLAAKNAAPLSAADRAALRSAPRLKLKRDEGTLLFGQAINGGTAVWQEDISRLNALHKEIRASVEKLKAANTLLGKEGEVRRQRLIAEEKVRLLAALEQEIGNRAEELRRVIDDFPTAANQKRQLAYITLLLCGIKRRSNIFFLEQAGEAVTDELLTVYFDELSEIAGYAGVKAQTVCAAIGSLAVSLAAPVYDYYFSVLLWAARSGSDAISGQLERVEGRLEFRLLSSAGLADCAFSAEFIARLDALGGSLAKKVFDDLGGLCLTLPERRDRRE